MKTPIPSSEIIIMVTKDKIITIKGDAICTYNLDYYRADQEQEGATA